MWNECIYTHVYVYIIYIYIYIYIYTHTQHIHTHKYMHTYIRWRKQLVNTVLWLAQNIRLYTNLHMLVLFAENFTRCWGVECKTQGNIANSAWLILLVCTQQLSMYATQKYLQGLRDKIIKRCLTAYMAMVEHIYMLSHMEHDEINMKMCRWSPRKSSTVSLNDLHVIPNRGRLLSRSSILYAMEKERERDQTWSPL